MQKVTPKRSVSRFSIIVNLSTNVGDTWQKYAVNTSFNMYNTIQNNEVSLVWRHLETLWRHFTRIRSFAKCLQRLCLDQNAMENWRHFAAQRLSARFISQSVNFEVSLSVSTQFGLSLRNVSKVSLDLRNFCQVSLGRKISPWQC